MEGNQMSFAFENQIFNRRSGLGKSRMGCTLVTGFLGSGKTTLLRHLLHSRGDLRLAFLVHEFADSDIDSVLLQSDHINFTFNNLPTISLTHGCDVRGAFRESLQRIVDSRENFDCLLVETSGLGEPDEFVAELEEVGIDLDLTVTVVDAESLDSVIKLDIVKKQLERVDLVLLNKCDLATLSQVSDAEDILERVTGGAKVVRSQFCKVPLDLLIDCGKFETLNAAKGDCNVLPVLSHEPLPKMAFRGDRRNPSVNISSGIVCSLPLADGDGEPFRNPKYGLPQDVSFYSATFQSDAPLSLSLFQSKVLKSMNNKVGLLRAKGILYFLEDRKSRFVFQWSGLKRVEAVSGRPWDGAPKSCLVFIAYDKSELDDLIAQILQIECPILKSSTDNYISKEYARSFSKKVAADGRFKDPSLQKEPLVIFGLKGSPLRGIKESHLSGGLMRVTNGKGNIFLTATTSGEEYNLQLLFDEGSDPDAAWNEIRLLASAIIAKICKNFCPCRSELTAHLH